MGGFANTMMNMLLGWMRALVDAVWNFFESPNAGRMLAWFGSHWWTFALVLIGGGLLIDWIVWMFRWQPYHIWATRLRHMRKFFARLLGRTVEVVEPIGVDDAPHAHVRPTYIERRREQDFEGDLEASTWQQRRPHYDQEPVEASNRFEPVRSDYDDFPSESRNFDQLPYDQGYQPAYDNANVDYYPDSEDENFDPHAAYRRPMQEPIAPPIIPDSQLQDYPGKHYDPSRLPRVSFQTAPVDPLAPYDAYSEEAFVPQQTSRSPQQFEVYDPAPVAYQPQQFDTYDPPPVTHRPQQFDAYTPASASHPSQQSVAYDKAPVANQPQQLDTCDPAPVTSAPGRRSRRRESQNHQPPQPPVSQPLEPLPTYADETWSSRETNPLESPALPKRRGARQTTTWDVDAQHPEFDTASQPAYQDFGATYETDPPEYRYQQDAAYEPDAMDVSAASHAEPMWQEEPFDADDLPATSKWPQWNVHTPSSNEKQPKMRGKLLQMFSAQQEQIKGLPPRVSLQQAFHKPTMPQQYDPRQNNESSPWDEDL